MQKGVYPCEYRDAWKKFSNTLLPEKKCFYSHLNTEDITDAYYTHAKIICKDFEMNNSGEHHDPYVQSNTLLLAYVFENSRNMSLELDPKKFLSAPSKQL